jgi:hypothetical protein
MYVTEKLNDVCLFLAVIVIVEAYSSYIALLTRPKGSEPPALVIKEKPLKLYVSYAESLPPTGMFRYLWHSLESY